GFGTGKRELPGAGVRVEQLALRRRAQQRLVLVLSVQVHEELAAGLELRKRRGVPVDEATRAPRAVDRAAQDDAPRIALEPGLSDESLQRRMLRRVKLGRQI